MKISTCRINNEVLPYPVFPVANEPRMLARALAQLRRAEGFFLSGLKRSGQALELRLALDALLDTDQHAAIAICANFNAEDHETPLKIVISAEEDTGNGLLANRSMVVLDRTLPEDRRFSVLRRGRPQMISRSLYGRFLTIQAHNETLEDEVIGGARVQHSPSSFHAPVVAEFAFD
jgi:hypothetical protein